jgi:hypothetical protein
LSASASYDSVDPDKIQDKSKATSTLYDEACFAKECPIVLAYKSSGSSRERRSTHGVLMRDARLTYGVLNCSGHRFLRGFPFLPHLSEHKQHQPCTPPACNEKSGRTAIKPPSTRIFPVTFCPPHDLELVMPSALKYLSVDLGFTVVERGRFTYVSSVTTNSPAELAGVQALDTIKFAFEHSLSSSFHNQALTPSEKLSSASISVISHLEPMLAVYHPTERESELAADYALECVKNGRETDYPDFCDMFVFDVTKSRYAHKPISFEGREEPVLYPVTIVFERGGGSSGAFNLDLNDVRKTVDDTYSKINPFLKYAFTCLDVSYGTEKTNRHNDTAAK